MSILCQVCGRVLKNPDSIGVGMGPICWAKINGCDPGQQACTRPAVVIPPRPNWPHEKLVMPKPEDCRGRIYRLRPGIVDDVVIAEYENGSQYDVRHIAYHSPTGMTYGYSGSGPSDCARSILADCVGLPLADALYQDFKNEFIAPIEHKLGGDIPEQTILAWIVRHMPIHTHHELKGCTNETEISKSARIYRPA